MRPSYTYAHKVYIVFSFLTFSRTILSSTFTTQDIPLPIINGQYISSCTSQGNNYFDSTSHSCGKCTGTGQIADSNTLNTYGDPTSCTCSIGYVKATSDCSNNESGTCTSITCTQCSSPSTSYSDNSACVSCGSTTTGLQPTTGDCGCSSSKFVLVEEDFGGNKLSSKECNQCKDGTLVITSNSIIAGAYYSADLYTCQSCPDPTMLLTFESNTYRCSCPSSAYNLVGVAKIGTLSCILNSISSSYNDLVKQTAATVTYYSFNNLVVSPSLTLEHYFVPAASYCDFYGGPQDSSYCQTLANLCVLQLYDDQTVICQTFRNILNARGSSNGYVNSILSWGYNLPWLSYTSAGTANSQTFPDPQSVCKDRGFKTTVSLDSQQFRYIVSEIALNGTFLGYSNLETLLSYCSVLSPSSSEGGGTSSSTYSQQFATNLPPTSRSCDLSTLLFKPQSFYELFLTDGNVYYPVPVRMTNLRSGGIDPNTNTPEKYDLCSDSDALVRRFFLFDRVSGISSSSPATNSLSSKINSITYLPDVIRYASKIDLSTVLDADNTGRILSPVLTITYTETNPGSWESTPISTYPVLNPPHYSTPTIVSYTVSMTYSSDLTSFSNYLRGFFIATMVVLGLLIIMRYYIWTKRNARIITDARYSTDFGGFNLRVIGEIILLAIHSYVLLLFPFTVLTAWYLFVTYKLQKSAFLLLPLAPSSPLTDSSSIYFSFYVNIYIMAFFQLAYVFVVIIYRHGNSEVYFIDWETAPSQATKPLKASYLPEKKVSIWRTLFIANEYIALSTRRRTNIIFTLFFMVLILIGLNYQADGSYEPSLTAGREAQGREAGINPVLRFAGAVWWWVLLSGGQLLYRLLFHERYITELPEQIFIDLCTIAKISVVILDETYHGYYLHCRSPHPTADGTMLDLTELLAREEAGLTVDRALEDGPKDVQSFQMYLTHEFRAAYNQIYQQLASSQAQSAFANNGASSLRGRYVSRRGSALGAGVNNFLASGQPLSQGTGTSINGPAASTGGNISGSTRAGGGEIPSEKTVKAWTLLIEFLREFVDNNLGAAGLRRKCVEPTYFEYLLNLPPNLTAPNQPSLLYPDRLYDFTKTMFLGQERDLLLLEILAFSLFDIWFGSEAISAVCTYLLGLGISKLRHRVSQVLSFTHSTETCSLHP